MNVGLPRGVVGEYPDRFQHSFGHEQGRLAVVVGSAPCRDDDLAKLNGAGDVIAVNRSGIVIDHVAHWISIHGDFLPAWLDERVAAGRDLPKVLVGNFLNGNHDERISRWEVCPYPGSSSMYAIRWALYWGYRRIVLCGVPLTGDQTVLTDGTTKKDCKGYHVYHGDWEKQMDKLPLAECVRSFSGWTRELLGSPEREFLEA
jgi:hypothetical protein